MTGRRRGSGVPVWDICEPDMVLFGAIGELAEVGCHGGVESIGGGVCP